MGKDILYGILLEESYVRRLFRVILKKEYDYIREIIGMSPGIKVIDSIVERYKSIDILIKLGPKLEISKSIINIMALNFIYSKYDDIFLLLKEKYETRNLHNILNRVIDNYICGSLYYREVINRVIKILKSEELFPSSKDTCMDSIIKAIKDGNQPNEEGLTKISISKCISAINNYFMYNEKIYTISLNYHEKDIILGMNLFIEYFTPNNIYNIHRYIKYKTQQMRIWDESPEILKKIKEESQDFSWKYTFV